jgi:hypothetical protein
VITQAFTRRCFRAEPRTPKEREVFTVMTVSPEGAEIYIPGDTHVLRLKDAAACAVLEELAASARRRLFDLQIDDMRLGHGEGAAAAPMGAAGEAGSHGAPI